MTGIKIFELLKICDSLKHLKRTGWTKFAIAEPETVACHMYRMAILAMSLKGQIEGIDADRMLRMCLVHDIAEALVGDITPHCGVSEQEKFALEDEAIKKIGSFVPEQVGSDWIALWKDYESQTTIDAKVVKHLDKFDMIAQAFDYEKSYGVDLSQFFNSTKGVFTLEPFVDWDTELRDQREQWIKEKGIKRE